MEENPIDIWNVSQVEDMSCLFMYWNRFNEPIGSWDECSLFVPLQEAIAVEEFGKEVRGTRFGRG
jgi:hypothetical protein